LRGVTSPAPDITDGELEILTKAGGVGMRFARRATPELDLRTLQRGVEHGWYPQYFLTDANDVAAWSDSIRAQKGRFVLDNLGNPSSEKGVRQRGVPLRAPMPRHRPVLGQAHRALLATGEFPVRRHPALHPPRGSDLPHPGYSKPMPNDTDLVDLVSTWVPDEARRRKLFVDNPAELFGFPSLH
jgi:hypothetical protein